jgi:hypothetical protein
MEWHTGSGKQLGFREILNKILKHHTNNGTIFIGTDSFSEKKACVFATSVVLLGADGQKGGRYFIKKEKVTKPVSFYNRILQEAERSIELALKITEIFPDLDLEVHLDISAEDKNEKTSPMAKMLMGYTIGSGFKCKIKPNSFAATSVADKHSK